LIDLATGRKEITRTDWRSLPVGYLSPTQVWGYISCPYCYWLERIARVPKPISADLMIGRFAHASLSHMRSLLVADSDVPANQVEMSVEIGAQAFETVITEQAFTDEDGDTLPVEVELTKKFKNLGEAKDLAVNLVRYSLPLIAKYDKEAGVAAYEARVRHLGPSFHGYPELFAKMSPEEQADAEEESTEQFVDGIKPVFPFPFKAFLDVLYLNGVLKDAKTASKNGSPGNLEALQLVEYDLSYWAAGEPHKLGWDVMIKTKNPNFAVYWLNGDGAVTDEQYEYVRWRVLAAADAICNGDFPPNDGSLFCKYEHGLPKGERAAMEDWSIPAPAVEMGTLPTPEPVPA
jgi:hypothetical protein